LCSCRVSEISPTSRPAIHLIVKSALNNITQSNIMPPRLPTTSLRSLTLIRSYATQTPPPPFTAPVANDTSASIPPSHAGTTSPSSSSASAPSSATTYPSYASGSSTTLVYSDKPRVYPIRKQFLTEYYTHLLKRSSTFLLFEYDNLAVSDWNKIRVALSKVPVPAQPTPVARRSRNGVSTTPAAVHVDTSAKLEVVRTGVFGAASRKAQAESTSLSPWLIGQRAVIHSQHFSPPYIKALLVAARRGIKQCQREGKPDEKQPMFRLVVGLADGRLVGAQEIEEIAKLPDLDTLRSQVLGTLESPGRQLLGTLQAAGGGGLVRTLQGLEESLKEGQEEAGESKGDAPSA